MTPAAIAAEIQVALRGATGARSRRLLTEALDAVSDGLPADDVASILRRVLVVLEAGPEL